MGSRDLIPARRLGSKDKLLRDEAAKRWSIFEAGIQSAGDPRYTSRLARDDEPRLLPTPW